MKSLKTATAALIELSYDENTMSPYNNKVSSKNNEGVQDLLDNNNQENY